MKQRLLLSLSFLLCSFNVQAGGGNPPFGNGEELNPNNNSRRTYPQPQSGSNSDNEGDTTLSNLENILQIGANMFNAAQQNDPRGAANAFSSGAQRMIQNSSNSSSSNNANSNQSNLPEFPQWSAEGLNNFLGGFSSIFSQIPNLGSDEQEANSGTAYTTTSYSPQSYQAQTSTSTSTISGRSGTTNDYNSSSLAASFQGLNIVGSSSSMRANTTQAQVSSETVKKSWSELSAPALNQLYYEGTRSYMDKRYLANHPFPIHLLGSYPTDWYELTDICAKGRDISHNQNNDLLQDVWANIAEQTGLLSTDGKDTVRADRQLRHIGNQMSNRNIDIYTARSLLEKLGYHPITMMSRGKTILDFSNFNPTVSTVNQALGTDVSPIINNVAQNCRQQ